MACSAPGTAVLLVTLALQALAQTTPGARHSGFDDMSPALQAMQRQDGQNPAMLAVQDGAALWSASPGAETRSCRDCHGDAPTSMRGVAARYPAWDITTQQALNLSGRINACRQRHQRQPTLAPDHPDSLGLAGFLGLQSRGLPVSPPDDAHLAGLREQGRALWHLRQGQLNLSCAQCHEQRAGQRLGGALIPEAHANGYPTYRLEWQGLGSLQRRLSGCLAGVRAQPYGPGANEWLALEAWMAMRDRGMPVETPAVRP
jgi:L-cysteine S-thiosulfotransferase